MLRSKSISNYPSSAYLLSKQRAMEIKSSYDDANSEDSEAEFGKKTIRIAFLLFFIGFVSK